MTRRDRAVLERVARLGAVPPYRELTPGVMQSLAAREGSDVTTALLYTSLRRDPAHAGFIEEVESRLRSGGPCGIDVKVAVVPGACWVEYPQTGADGGRLLELGSAWGCRVERVPLDSFGSLEENAATLCRWLERQDEPVALVSLSKGAADVRFALERPDAARAFRQVRAWVSLSGIIHGTALASFFLRHLLPGLFVRFLCWRHGYRLEVLRQIERRSRGPLAPTLRLPGGLPVVHVVGFPLRHHLGRRGRAGEARARHLGPSDGGGFVLGDVGRLPGLVYPVWGADHYLDPSRDVRPLIGRIIQCACEGATECAPEKPCEEVRS
jgi:hypothetical protein